MKTQIFKGKSKSVVSRATQVFTAISITLICIFSIFTSAFAESAIRVENCNMCESYSQKLGSEINDFIMLDTEPNKTVSSQVTASINEYRKEIIDLQSHPDVEKRSLENEILLSYSKGNAAGRLAWVYYYNIYTFDNDLSIEKINAKYTSFKASIANAAQSSVLSAECEVMLDELNRLIFSEKAKNLALPSDSLTSSSLISGAVEEFKTIYSPDIFGEEYRKAYSNLTDKLGLQRVRDAITAEAKRVFLQISSEGSFDSSPTAALLVYNLKNSETVKKMNTALLDFCEELLSIDENKPYSAKLKQDALSLTQTACARATENGKATDLGDIFAEYRTNLKKAEIKDTIYLLLLGSGGNGNSELIELEQKYNAEDGIVNKCTSDSDIASALTDAKSELFLLEHKVIVQKPFSELSKDDEELAISALTNYTSLDDDVKSKLLAEINIIAEKYNYILTAKMRSLMPEDALYLDFCEKIASELKNISRDNIDDFYNKSSKIHEKAQALSAVINEYRNILSEPNYQDYNDGEKKELLTTLEIFSKALSLIDPADVAIYSDEISNARSSAIRALNVTDQCARVRIATRNSKNTSVAEELRIATERIKACAEKNEMILQASRAIYKIQRHLTSDAILDQCSALKSSITKSEFLTSKEKENLIASLSTLSNKAKDAREAENLAALESIWSDFSAALLKIQSEAEAIDRSRAISSYLEKVEKSSAALLESIKKLEYITEEKSAEIYNNITSLKNQATEAIPTLKSSQEITDYFANFLKLLDKISKDAETSELNGYKLHLLSEFDKYEKIKANYSTENYNKILNFKTSVEEQFASASNKTACDRIAKEAHNAILLINDLLDDEKESANNSLLETLNALKKLSPLYSAENFAKIEGLYDEGKIEINKINGIENIAAVKQALAKYLTLISAIRRDRTYTSEAAYNITAPSLRYPDGYDLSNGLLGSVELSNGIASDANLSIRVLSQSNNESVERLIRRAAKSNSFKIYEPLSSETKKLLRSAAVAMTLDISLSSVCEGASGYTLQMLMPNELAEENVLGLAFVKGDNIEFYPISRADQLISVNLEHFSSYYVVVESTLNVRPLLIVLVILLILEFIVLIALLYLRRKRNTEETTNSEQSNLPDIPMSAIIPFAPILTRIYPENGVVLAVLLAVAVIALAATIALLIKNEAARPRENKQKLLKGRSTPQLLKGKSPELIGENAFFENSENELCRVGANCTIRGARAEIDLDLIAAHFNSYETVNIQSLKDKGLINADAEHVKIFTKGNLIKPLKIEADEFSNAAKEIIKLSGGEMIEK